MSFSKPLPPFVCDALYYLTRDQLERFSIACRPLKNFIERYLHTKPYRVFNRLCIRGGSYALFNNSVQWHPNREDYSVQQFFANQKCSIERDWNDPTYYSFAEMRPYLGPTVRIKQIVILAAGDSIYGQEHITEMESIAYLWRTGNIFIRHANDFNSRIGADELQLILNSPIILQCRELLLVNAHFSFKDYNVLYAVKEIKIYHNVRDEIDLWHQHWQQFLDRPGVKPIVFFRFLRRENVENLLDRFHKVFSSAISQSAFKILFAQRDEPLTEFRETNYTSRERLELKKGFPVEYQSAFTDPRINYTLERSSM